MKKNKIIVGDCFENFNQHADVVSLKKFKQLDPSSDEVSVFQYFIGQGISSLELDEIRLAKPDLYKMIINPNILIKEPRIAHKRKVENCHITPPVKINETEYTLGISVDSKCCELSDHITGEHINGIILIEAARQAYISVTEAYFIDKNDKVYFILKKLDCQFENFLFPLNIEARYKILHFEKKAHLQMDFEVEVAFYHHEEEVACTMKGFFSVYPKVVMENLESELADNAVEAFYTRKQEVTL